LEVAFDLGGGHEEVIKIYTEDNIEGLVDVFCTKHNISNIYKPRIIEQIKTKLSDPSMQSIRLKKCSADYSSSANITEENEESKEVLFGDDSKYEENNLAEDFDDEAESKGKLLPEDFNKDFTPQRVTKPIIETKAMIERLIKYRIKKKHNDSYNVSTSRRTFTPSINKK
jgi:hypothetical protein